ncbi:MAG TPA: pinensin family lanthipeptide [Longimicrobiaceae bacterium]|nr:pinensin family lanthipeptide [Longimicrobiaceae bacterium]
MRKKLHLKLEDLTVESFPTASADDERGTVRGQEATPECTKSCTNCTFDDTLCGLTWHCSNAPPFC